MNLFIISMIQFSMLSSTGWVIDFDAHEVAETGSIAGVWIGTLIGETLILAVTLFFAVQYYNGRLGHFNFRIPSLKHLGIAIGGAFLAFGVSYIGNFLNYLATGSDPNEDIYNALFRSSNWFEVIIWIILMMAIVGTCEEIFARGFVQKGLQNSCQLKNMSVFIGILLASLLFAAVHLDIYRIIPLFFVGIVLGLVFYFTKDNSLAAAITHGLYNSIGILLIFLFP